MDEREALLAALRDPLPPEVGWWPPAIGWWLLATLLVVAASGAALARRRRRRGARASAWPRAARDELEGLRARLGEAAPDAILAEASVLARRALLAVAPRAEIAALHGDAWLGALDAASGGTRFSRGPGRLLAHGPYERAPRATPAELAGLLDALGALIGTLEAANADRSRRSGR